MRNLLRDRQGVSAFVTVLVLTPLIGAVSIGAEAGSWYVTRQSAQNAADAAAYSAALRLTCTIGVNGGTCPTDTHTVDYRGKEFAAQNWFCKAGDTTSYSGSLCSSGLQTLQNVKIEAGPSSAGPWTDASVTAPTASDTAIRATITQTQSAYLAAILLGNGTTVTIPGVAIALVETPNNPICALGLGRYTSSGALKLGGNFAGGTQGCGVMSDNSVQFASSVSFPSGAGWGVYGVSGCTPAGTCNTDTPSGIPTNYYTPYAYDPLVKLDSESFNSRTGSTNPCNPTCTLSPNNSTGAYTGNLTVTNGKTLTLSSGTYFFYDATIKVNNGGAINGTNVNIVLLGNSSLSISGSANLSANMNNTTYPDLNGVLFDDQAPTGSSRDVTINGSGTVTLGGANYFPNVKVKWAGTSQSTYTTCTEVIGDFLDMTGSSYLNSAGCPSNTVPKPQFVALVK
jgi:hypothetical protein